MKFEKRVFPNGMRVIAVPMPNSLTTTVLVLTETGSEYETKRTSGISHFLEHMCFKGTIRRPTAQAIHEELDGIGAQPNAFTGHEYTGYFAKAEARHLPRMLDIISDILLNSTLPKEEIEKERGVIIEEINADDDDPQQTAANLFIRLLYGDQPAGWRIEGTKRTVRAITREDLIAYRHQHYIAPTTVVVIAGKFDEKEIFDVVQGVFEGIPVGDKVKKYSVCEVQERPRARVLYKETNQTHIVLGFRSYDIFHDQLPALLVLEDILGGGMSSRLFRRIRGEMGVGYYVGTDSAFFTDHGFFGCFVGVNSSLSQEVVHALLDEIRVLRDTVVPESELTKAKNHIIGHMFSGIETSSAFASIYGMAEVLRRPIKTPQEIAERIQRVTAEEVQCVAQDIFQGKGLNLALVGPFKNTQRLKAILKI